MKVGIVGHTNFNKYDLLVIFLNSPEFKDASELISAGSRRTDEMVESYAVERGLLHQTIKLRGQEAADAIVEQSDKLLMFIQPGSTYCNTVLTTARLHGKLVKRVLA